MPPPRRPRSRWRMPTPICGRYRPRSFASSASTGRGDGRTWRCSSSPRPFSQASRSTCITTERWIAISPMSTTSRTPSRSWSTPCRRSDLRARHRRRPWAQSRRAVPRGQYRERRSGAALGIHRGDRSEHRPEGDPQLSADAARRCPGNLRRYTSLLRRLTGFQPATPVSSGVDRFVAWYRDYYRV